MNPLDPLEKILDLIESQIDDVITQTKKFEGDLQTVKSGLAQYQAKADQLVSNAATDIQTHLDISVLENKIRTSTAFQQLQQTPLDINQLVLIWRSVDIRDNQHLKSMVTETMSWFEQNFGETQFNGVPAMQVFADIKEVLLTLIDIPEDLDPFDKATIERLKQSKIATIQPIVFKLLDQLFDLKLVGSELDNTLSAVEQAAETVAQRVPEATKAGTSELQQVIGVLDGIKTVVPALAGDLKPVSEPISHGVAQYGQEVLTYFSGLLTKLQSWTGNAKEIDQLEPKDLLDVLADVFPVLTNFSSEPNISAFLEARLPVMHLKEGREKFLQELHQIIDPLKDQDLGTLTKCLSQAQSVVPVLVNLFEEQVTMADGPFKSLCTDLLADAKSILGPFSVDQLKQVSIAHCIGALLSALETAVKNHLPQTDLVKDAGSLLAKLATVWQYLLNHDLVVPLKIHFTRELARVTELHANSLQGQVNTATPSDPSDASFDLPSPPTFEHMLQQLHGSQAPLAASYRSGDVFRGFYSGLELAVDRHITAVKNIGINLSQLWAEGKTVTLDDLVSTLFRQIKAFVKSVLKDVQTLLAVVIDHVCKLIELVIDLLMIIKLPVNEVFQTSDKSDDLSIPVLFFALPWRLVANFVNTTENSVESWAGS